ncbi:hypothetical protein INT43_000333 [Umbelopsis isabellina]|uniref:Uncharacterized protein n=1 Tax=Mortierella isabellina TaxID=91625 RepID=A0A8H7Q110_MORIS|nr:hypothetical protein INT43_000333 [Umbelopsis isabellina]
MFLLFRFNNKRPRHVYCQILFLAQIAGWLAGWLARASPFATPPAGLVTATLSMALPHELLARLLINGIDQGNLHNVHINSLGNAIMTDEHIASTIASRLDEQKAGQASVFDIASQLNVERDLVISVLSKFKQDKGWTVTNNYILTVPRQNAIVQDIDHDIAKNGYLSLAVKAQSLGLPYQYIQQLADSAVKDGHISTSKAVSSSGLLMSNDYIDTSLAKLRDALKEAIEPLAVQKLHRDNIEIPTALFYDLFEHIVKAEDVGGFTRGRRENALFVPNVYREDQESKLCQFVASNDYIGKGQAYICLYVDHPADNAPMLSILTDYKRLNTYHLYNATPKDFLVSRFPDIQFLDSCAVTSNVKLIMSAEIDEILGSGNQWINIATLVPSILSPTDISTLLASISDVKKDDRLVVLGSSYVTSNEWLEKAYASLRQHMQLKALGARKAKLNGSQLQKNSRRGRQASHEQDKLDKEELLETLNKNGSLALEPDLADLIIERLFNQAQSEYAKMLDSVYLPSNDTATPTESKPKSGFLNTILSETWCRFQLYMKGISVFDDSSVQSSLSKHLLRTLGQDLVDILIVMSAYLQERKTFVPALDQELDSRLKIELQDMQRDELINGMSGSNRENASKARTIAIAGKPSEEFLNLVKNLMSSIDTHIDNSEQFQAQQLKDNSDNLVNQLAGCNVQDAATAPLVLHLLVLICFQALYKCPLHASGKFVPKIVRQITPKLFANNLPEYAETIEKGQDTIMKALKSGNVYTEQDIAVLQQIKELGQKAAKDIHTM